MSVSSPSPAVARILSRWQSRWSHGFHKVDSFAVERFEQALRGEATESGTSSSSSSSSSLPASRCAVVLDFDLTVTRATVAECHHLIGYYPKMPAGFLQDCGHLWEVFHDPKHPERLQLCGAEDAPERPHSFWIHYHSYMVKHGVTKASIEEAIADEKKECGSLLRPGIRELLGKCQQHAIPVLIVSAGISQIIEGLFEAEAISLPPGSRIIANTVVFDGNGVCTDVVPHDPPCSRVGKMLQLKQQSDLRDRPCVIIVGDKPIDAKMAAAYPGVEEHPVHAFSFGFLNSEAPDDEALIEDYSGAFDVVPKEGRSCGFEMIVDLLEGLLDSPEGSSPSPRREAAI